MWHREVESPMYVKIGERRRGGRVNNIGGYEILKTKVYEKLK